MKKLLKIFLSLIGILVLVVIAALAYLNFIYLPWKVGTEGKAYLEEKTKGRVKAETIRYIPFKGVKLEHLAFISRTKKPILTIDRLYFNINFWPSIIQRELDFRIDIYPPKIKRPFILRGLYQIKQRKLEMDLKAKTNLFVSEETLTGKAKAFINKEGKSDFEFHLSSPDLNVQANLYLKDKNLYIEKFSVNILESVFDFIGDIQNISEPSLNIYGNLDLNLAGFKDINPEYVKFLSKPEMQGRIPGEIFISSQPDNLEIGLKLNSSRINIERTKIEDLSIISRMQNKKVNLPKFYARTCGGEINLEGVLLLDAQDFPASLNVNIFNLGLSEIIKNITDKDIPLHGRVFSLAKMEGYLKRPKDMEGKIWLNASGSNILELPLFKGVAEVLHLPELRKIEFKEASGNFSVASQEIRTDDFKILSNSIVLRYKGYMDFSGNLGFDIKPTFSQNFLLSAPNIANILGIFIDSAGNFLGEIKMKGNIKSPRYTFKPISTEKIFPKAIEEGLKHLFKFKKKEEGN